MKVFVHGNPETSAIWEPLVAALAARGIDDIVLLSPPGFGAPVPDGWDASQESYRDWLIAELAALGGEIDLVGHDWGAGHVYGVLAERPDLVRSWAADCGGLVHPDYVWHDAAQAWQTAGVGEEAIAGLVSLSSNDKAAFLVGLGFPPEIGERVGAAIDDTMGRCILDLYRAAAQPAMRDLGERLAATAVPRGLVVIATDDHYAGTPAMATETAAQLGAGTITLEGFGHWWMLQAPDLAAAGLASFWHRL